MGSVDELLCRVKRGEAITDAAGALGIPYHKAKRICKAMAVSPRTARARRVHMACELYRNGMTQEQVAHELGVYQSTVSRWLRTASMDGAR